MSLDNELSDHDHAPQQSKNYETVRKVLWAVLFANLIVTLVKIVIGISSGLLAVVADGFHSLVDSSSNLIGLAAIRLAQRPADDEHPYGYRKYETLGAMAIGGMLFVAAWEISLAVIERIVEGYHPQISTIALALLIGTWPVNLAVVFVETRLGRRLNSEILLADAKHTQTDLYVTGGVLISVGGVFLGLEWMDYVTAIVVVVLILRAGFNILSDTARWLTDSAVADAGEIAQIALSTPGVSDVHNIRSRGTPDSAFVDLQVNVDPGMSTSQAHAIASEIERKLIEDVENITDAIVHVEPDSKSRLTSWERMANDLRQIADGMGLGIHDLHIHSQLDSDYTVEVHIEIQGDISLREAHSVADEFEARVQKRWPKADKVITHLEPLPEKLLLPGDDPSPEEMALIEDILGIHLKLEQILKLEVFRSSDFLHAAVTICLPADLSLAEAHAYAEKIEIDLLKRVPALARVTLHVEPEV